LSEIRYNDLFLSLEERGGRVPKDDGQTLVSVATLRPVSMPASIEASYMATIKSHNPSGLEQPFSLQLIVPPSSQVKTISFDDTIALDKFINS